MYLSGLFVRQARTTTKELPALVQEVILLEHIHQVCLHMHANTHLWLEYVHAFHNRGHMLIDWKCFSVASKKIWLIISRPCQCLHLLKARASFWIFYRHGSHTKIAYWKMAKNAWSPLSNSCFLLFFFPKTVADPLAPKKMTQKIAPIEPRGANGLRNVQPGLLDCRRQ